MKKLWTNLVIFIGFLLLFVVVIGAILVSASGIELLGLSYIRTTSGKIELTETVADADVYGKIKITSNNIPTKIKFVQSHTLTAYLLDELNGFIRVNDEPSVTISKAGDCIFVESVEYDPFLLYSRSEASSLLIKVPMYYSGNIEVVSKKADVTITGNEATLGDVVISTTGAVNIESSLSVPHVALNVNNKNVTITENVNINGILEINSNRANISVPSSFNGSLKIKSTGGNLYLGNCSRLNYTSKSGRIYKNGESLPNISGDCDIETSGKVFIGNIDGNANISTKVGKLTIGTTEGVYRGVFNITTSRGKIQMLGNYTNETNNITSTSGNISIDKINRTNIKTKSGDVYIGSVNELMIENKNGNIDVLELVSNALVSGGRGDISFGSQDKTVASVLATTTSGDVKIINASGGNYNIKTKNGDINYNQNKNVKSAVQVVSKKGKVVASNLTGSTYIESDGVIDVSIHRFDGVEIKGGSKAVSVHTEINCYYDLSSNARFSKVPNLTEPTKEYSNCPTGIGRENVLKITTTHGEIIITKA